MRLLHEAALRIDAAAALLSLHSTYAATVATVAKEGRRPFEKLQKELAERVKGTSHGRH